MPRSDVYEYRYPSGQDMARSRGEEREQFYGYQHGQVPAQYGDQDRRPSDAAADYTLPAGAMPRSELLQEIEYGTVNRIGNIASTGPNRHNPDATHSHFFTHPFSSFNHQHLRVSSPPHPVPPLSTLYHSSPFNDRDVLSVHHTRQSATVLPLITSNTSTISRATLWWGELEPWMDEEYAKQVCGLMGWDSVNIKVPHPPPDSITGQQANNPGYCFLTFPTPAHAASVLSQINNSTTTNPVTMPNSSKPFVLDWASSVMSTSNAQFSVPTGAVTGPAQQYPKEYSIFVGDLAPETSNSDLVAVFRNPVLGLRNDREPKFIRPFLSCKSAKIMLDPVTGVSRGYGFVRFTDEADQQRALIEMHGLYCLSRPMRISPATAKFKPPPPNPPFELTQVQYSPPSNANGAEHQSQSITIALPLPSPTQKSVSAPIAATPSNVSIGSNGVQGSTSGSSLGGSNSINSLSSGAASNTSIATSAYGSVSSEDLMHLPNHVLVQIAQQYANGSNPIRQNNEKGIPTQHSEDVGPSRYGISEESWKHHAQARAILGNLIGPNGEQLTSTDPYNTTVFVGGLSPLISEDTLRTFFTPFGDIHYVKVPVGKHCGFVQFVRKADAERAIEKMQGFPIGGSRIRLSWGRSQYKAAQAAAQAAQAAALQGQCAPPTTPLGSALTQEQALELLQKLSMQGYLDNKILPGDSNGSEAGVRYADAQVVAPEQKLQSEVGFDREDLPPAMHSYANGFLTRSEAHRTLTSFSPFSPELNLYATRHDQVPFGRPESVPHPLKTYNPGFHPSQGHELAMNVAVEGNKVSPTSVRPHSATRYNSFHDVGDPLVVNNRRPEAPISRPSSGPSCTIGHLVSSAGQDYDTLHDLNGTLASLELDRPWKNPQGSERNAAFGQHRAGRTPSP